MTGAFGWHLPIWCDTSLPEIGWWAFHSPYISYYSRNASSSWKSAKRWTKIMDFSCKTGIFWNRRDKSEKIIEQICEHRTLVSRFV